VSRLRALLAAVIAAGLLAGCVPTAVATDSVFTEVAEGNTGEPRALPGEYIDRLNAALSVALTLAGASGAVAGVWAPWAGRWLAAPGTTGVDGTAPVTADQRFRIGTNTTAMTCTVLMDLVDEGTVSLDDPVTRYLQRMPGLSGITLGQLCANTSGLADYAEDLAPQFVNNPTRIWLNAELVASGMAITRVGDPGNTWTRSNTGIVLLGMALESATGRTWNELYRQYIFTPLGLTDTDFPAPRELQIADPTLSGLTTALGIDGQAVCGSPLDVSTLSNSMGGVAGGVVSNLNDLKTWTQALAAGSLITPESAKAQWATIPRGDDSPLWQRAGLGVDEMGPLRGSSGSIPGYISASYADPTSGLTIVVMLNNSGTGDEFAAALVRELASIVARVPAAKVTGVTAPAVQLPWSQEQAHADQQALAVCPGALAP
jgi:D-alanyl-D-alanine carboxypeptidase